MPLGVTNPKACVAWSTSPHVAPPSTRAVPASDGEEQPLLTREIDRGDDVGDVDTLGDQGGMLVNHRVVDLARVVVARVARTDEVSP
jgi:hypothetical protein